MDNIQNCDNYINILLGSYQRRNVFPVRYGQAYKVELN
jgi:hypothetical protein